MALGNYKYTGDSGTLYQVTVPVDFAVALGMVAAAGGEPYLDSSIAPRYFTYFNPTTGQYRQAVVQDQTTFGSPPATLTIGSDTFYFRSAIGESIPASFNNVFSTQSLIQGPPGPAGSGGIALVDVGTIDSGIAVSYTGGVDLYTSPGLSDGTYLFLVSCSFTQTSGVADCVALSFRSNILGYLFASSFGSPLGSPSSGDESVTGTVAFTYTASAGDVMKIQAGSYSENWTTSNLYLGGSTPAGKVTVLKVA